MPGLPSGLKVEVEFSAGVWTDVTSYVDGSSVFTIRKGRSSEWDDSQPGTLETLTLRNDDGRFTPRKQTLANGSAHPYYPNVIPRRRIRVSYTASGTRIRFLGEINGWPVDYAGGSRAVVTISAVDDQRSWSEIELRPLWQEAILKRSPLYFWPLTEESGSTEAANLGSVPGASLTRWDKGGGKSVALGADLAPYAEGGTTLFANEGVTNTERVSGKQSAMRTQLPQAPTFPFSLVAVAQSAQAQNSDNTSGYLGPTIVAIRNRGDNVASIKKNGDWLVADRPNNGTGSRAWETTSAIAADPLPAGSTWATIVVRYDAVGTTRMFINGVEETLFATIENGSFDRSLLNGTLEILVGGGAFGPWSGRIGAVAIIPSALSAADAADIHAAIMTAYAPEGSGARASRLAALGGVSLTVSSDEEPLGVGRVAGKSLAEALRDVAGSEGGGSVIGVGPDGVAQFWGRPSRVSRTPVLTVSVDDDGAGDLSLDNSDSQIVNVGSVTGIGDRASTATSPTSIAVYGKIERTGTSIRATAAGDRQLAESFIAGRSEPAPRIQRVVIDVLTAETAGLYAAIASIRPGSVIRVTDLPETSPRSYLDVRVEGWTETIGLSTYQIAFDTSPLDDVVGVVLDDSTTGILGAEGTMTLTSSIASGATSISVTTASGPTLSTSAGDYPLTFRIGEEEVVATAAPGSATSPQTLSVTRAANGTRAAAQSAGAIVSIAPDPSLGL